MSGTIAKIVPQVRQQFRPPSAEERQEQIKMALESAPAGNCPKCGGRPLLLGVKYADNLPRQCMKCKFQYKA